MKRILITGKSSYVGTKFMEWVSQWPDEYQVDAISVRGDEWKQHDFSGFESVVHVAGIAHIKETKENRELYYKVNRDLAFEVAKKSKEAGIPHFIFLSSMSIYGLETGVIDKDTVPKPKSAYGKSKYEAEKLIEELENQQFKIAVVRPPMIYGPNCPGNFAKLSKLAKITPIFPKVKNQRSMIFIDNLSNYLVQLIKSQSSGNFHPQNEEYVCTYDLLVTIARIHFKKVYGFNVNKKLLTLKLGVLRKIFGDLVYSQDISKQHFNYNTVNFEQSIIKSEKEV